MDELAPRKMPRYFDEETGQPLHLYFGRYLAAVDGVEVELEGVPLLRNEKTGGINFTFKTAAMVDFFAGEAKKERQSRIRLTPKPRDSKTYKYCSEVGFLYSDIDYEHVPGLVRPWDEGFLTPVFFNLAVLNKYAQNPGYRLNLFSESYGNIEADGWIISFGVNRNQLVIMWLGDIDKLPIHEQYYLRSENVDSDHEIHSEFYDAQIDCIPSPPSKQSALLGARARLDELVKKSRGFPLFRLEGEVDRIVKHLHRPVFWEDRHVAPVIDALNKIFVESLNVGELKGSILSVDAKAQVKSLGSLKSLSVWLDRCTNVVDAYKVMTPYFVLYDFRVTCAHLTSDQSRMNTFDSVCERLGAERTERSNEQIYDLLIEQLLESVESIYGAIEN